MPTKPVDVLLHHPTYQKILKQIDKGLKKYHTPVNPQHYTVREWLNHWQEETVDALTYQHVLEERLNEAYTLLNKALDTYDPDTKAVLERLKEVLFG